MITITPISVSDVENHFEERLNCAGIPDSSWMGEASAYFRLEGPVQRQPLVSLFEGRTPDGKVALFSGSLQEAAPDGWRIQFTAPPTVRNLWVLAPSREQAEFQISQEHATNYCLSSLERALRGPANGRLETQTPGIALAVVAEDPVKQRVPELRTIAFLPNLHMPIHGKTDRIPLPTDALERKAKALNSLYTEKLFGRLHWSLGLEFVKEGQNEARLIGVPETLDFSSGTRSKQASSLAKFLKSPLALQFQDWRSRVAGQGWDTSDAKALLQFSRERKSIWSAFENARLERLEKKQIELEPPKKVTKTLFTITTTTHSY